MNQPDCCPECGAELPTGDTEGLCPKCLMGAGLASRNGSPEPAGGDAFTAAAFQTVDQPLLDAGLSTEEFFIRMFFTRGAGKKHCGCNSSSRRDRTHS